MIIKRILAYFIKNEDLKDLFFLEISSSYDEFITILLKRINKIVQQLEDSRNLYQNHPDEDLITSNLILALNSGGLNIAHGHNVGGKVDILVSLNKYRWIGEAKIYYDLNSPKQGFAQLNTRYSTARYNENKGGLLLYIFRPRADKLMHEWMLELLKQPYEELSTRTDTDPLIFYSSHRNCSSGQFYETVHLPIIFHHDPKDKSALNRKTK